MPDIITNRCSFVLATAITSATQTAVTRTVTNDGLPGDSNGPPSGPFKVSFTDGTNWEIAQVVLGQGTLDYTLVRAVEAIGGIKAALASVPANTVCYAGPMASDLQAAIASTASSIVGGQQLVSVGPGGSGLKIVSGGFGVHFEGLTAQLLSAYSALVSAGSIAFWLNPDLDLTQTQQVVNLNTSNLYVNQQGAGPLLFNFSQATVSQAINDTVALSSLSGAWHLWVWTFTESSGQLYRDGALVGSSSGGSGAPLGPASGILFGGAGGAGAQGSLAHCAFWETTVLTAAQVSALYANASSMTESAYESYVAGLSPTLYYPMQENTGSVATNKGTTGSTDNATYSGNYLLGMPGPIGGQPTLQTSPPAPTGSIVITSGTAYQNTAPYDVMLRVPVAYSAGAATLAVGAGPTNSPPQVTEVSRGASALAETLTTTVYLPAGWYLLLTATGATLGLATSQPV